MPLRHEKIPEKAIIAKRQIEIYYRDFFQRFQERTRVNARIDYDAVCGKYDERTRIRLRREQFMRELEYIRRRNQPLSMADFQTIRKIGQGSYGEVYLVRQKRTGELFAIKKLHKRDMVKRRQVSHVWLERFVLATVGEHQHVVKMFYSFQDSDYLYLVMEYLPGGDLLSMLLRHNYLPENWARFYIAELIVAIDALHRTGIIHRDIKPDNVLFSKTGHVVLSDFGLCKFVLGDLQSSPTGPANAPNFMESVRSGQLDLTLQERKAAWKAVARNRVFSAVGTPSYIAPEVLNETTYTEACDWWSVGAILYEMLIGVPPFLTDKPELTIELIRNWREYLEFPTDWPTSRLSSEALDLMKCLLCDASVRLGTKEGLEEFKRHPFFKGVEWTNLTQQKAPFVPVLKDDVDTRYFDEEISDPPYVTSNANTSSNSSNDNTGSNAGSVDTAVVAVTTPSSRGPPPPQTGIGMRKTSNTRKPPASRSRLRDLDFLGFTYTPMSPPVTGSSWPSDPFWKSSSGSLRSSSSLRAPQRVRSTTTIGTCETETSHGFTKRSNSAGPGTRTGILGHPPPSRHSVSARNGPPLPPIHRPSTDGGSTRTRQEDNASTDINIHGLGISPISEAVAANEPSPDRKSVLSDTSSQLNSTPLTHQREHELVLHHNATTEELENRTTRKEDGVVEGKLFKSVSDNVLRTSTHLANSNIQESKNDDAEEGDCILEGLGAIEVTETYPTITEIEKQAEEMRVECTSEVGSTLTPDLQPLIEPETDTTALWPPRSPKPRDRQVSTHGRAHKLSLIPEEATLELENDVEVPVASIATHDVVSFVADAVESMEVAAADLDADKTTGLAKDVDAVVRDAAKELNGQAIELHRAISESNS